MSNRSWLSRSRNRADPPGQEPDYRFSLANERTFLAWNRTAMALIAGGVAITQLFHNLASSGVRQWSGLVAIALGAALAAGAFIQWRRIQVAIRVGQPLPYSVLPLVLTIGLVSIATVTVLIVAWDLAT